MTSEDQNRLPAGIYQKLFEYAADPIFVLDLAEGNFIEANQAACDHLGYGREELLRMGPEHIDDAATLEKVPERVAQLKKGLPLTFEATHIHRNGTHIPVEMHIRPIEHEGRVFALNICRNITERKQREIEYQTIVQATTDGFWIVSASDARILEVNEAYCKMIGYTRDEMLSMHISDLEAVESPEETGAHIRKVMETGHDFFETKHRRKDGHIIEVEVATSYSGMRGGVLFAFVRDISERKQVKRSLIESEEKFRQLFEKAPVGIAMARQDQKIFIANAAFCRMFGHTQEELRHLTITDLTHPDYRDKTRHLATGVLQGDIPVYAFEKRYLRKGGETFWGRIVATEVGGEAPQARYIMGIVEDITARIEEETHRQSENIKQKEMLVRAIHHRIGNGLQRIIGLLRQYVSGHPEMAEVTNRAIGMIYSVATIHGMQSSSASEEVDLAALMENIISKCGCRITFSNELISPVFLNKDQAVPVALALNELVGNACKHCSINSSIAISLKANESRVAITIANHFDSSRIAVMGGGKGLNLVKLLLPKESANILITQTGNVFLIELTFTYPLVTFGSHAGNRDHP